MAVTDINIAQPDITLRLDLDGVVREAKMSPALRDEVLADWIGRPWREVAGDDVSAEKITRLIDEARNAGVSGFRQITQRFPSGLELPIEYTAVRVGEAPGLIVIGRNLQAVAELQSKLISAQRAIERDYWKLRHIETRYRMLFDAASDAVLLVSASDLSTIEANPAAIRALGIIGAGDDFLSEIPEEERSAVEAMFRRVQLHGKAPGSLVHFGPEQKAWLIRASLLTSDTGSDFLVQFSPASDPVDDLSDAHPDIPFLNLLDGLPDGLVVADAQGRVVQANDSFRQMAQVASEEALRGASLGRWLNQPGVDLSVLLANLKEYRSIGHFPTRLQGELGAEREIEISASLDRSNDTHPLVLVVRDVGRRIQEPRSASSFGLTLSELTEQIGKTGLRDLVAETVSAIERHFIEHALGLTAGNRTATAHLLGLSRQSLYLKIKRYGLADSGDDPEDN